MDRQEFLQQAAIAAMQAMIQARALTEAAEARNQATAVHEDRGTLYEPDENLFSISSYGGVNSPINLAKDGDGQYTWGELVAEEAFEIADCMLVELDRRGGK